MVRQDPLFSPLSSHVGHRPTMPDNTVIKDYAQ
nr:MAG TPA: hypothetical protein [Caudoviricetes sp.]